MKEILSGDIFDGEVRFTEPMRNHTSLRIGGPADIFTIPRDILSLNRLYAHLARNHLPVFALGGGTNILVKDGGIEGAVISFRSLKKIDTVSKDSEWVNLSVAAGTLLQSLVRYAQENGYSGMEGLAGIPGTVGGAICGNAGAFGQEIKDVLIAVEIMDNEGNVKRVHKKDMRFGYRSSGILPGELLTNAEMQLRKDSRKDVASRVEAFLRIKREKQPIWEPSAGCVFKNPPGLAAGKLIDEAGCKGMRIGDAEVSTLHANFFINKGKATASDFITLMKEVARRVREKFHVILEPEIRIVGRDIVNG